MHPMKQGMDNMDYSALRSQGYYDNMNQIDPSFLNPNMQLHSSFNFGDGFGGNGLDSMIPRNDQNINYYQEYCRLFLANVVLTTQMKELIAEKNELYSRIVELEKGGKGTVEYNSKSPEIGTDKKSRIRRKAAEVERHYKCPVVTCQKSYGSEGSLIQHVKLKHPAFSEDPDWKMKLLKPEGEGEENEEDQE